MYGAKVVLKVTMMLEFAYGTDNFSTGQQSLLVATNYRQQSLMFALSITKTKQVLASAPLK
jgi:hypothetical protein